jgi:hypothetical protein
MRVAKRLGNTCMLVPESVELVVETRFQMNSDYQFGNVVSGS